MVEIDLTKNELEVIIDFCETSDWWLLDWIERDKIILEKLQNALSEFTNNDEK